MATPFRNSAKELLVRLRRTNGPWELRVEAMELEELFDRIERDENPSAERMAAIQRLISLHRRVLEFLIKK